MRTVKNWCIYRRLKLEIRRENQNLEQSLESLLFQVINVLIRRQYNLLVLNSSNVLRTSTGSESLVQILEASMLRVPLACDCYSWNPSESCSNVRQGTSKNRKLDQNQPIAVPDGHSNGDSASLNWRHKAEQIKVIKNKNENESIPQDSQ